MRFYFANDRAKSYKADQKMKFKLDMIILEAFGDSRNVLGSDGNHGKDMDSFTKISI